MSQRLVSFSSRLLYILTCLWGLSIPALSQTAPTILPGSGSYDVQQNVTISGTGTILYSLDGSQPSVPYTTGQVLPITRPTQINAVSVVSGVSSSVTSAWLDVDPTLAPIASKIPFQPTYRYVGNFGLVTSPLGAPARILKWIDLSGYRQDAVGNPATAPTLAGTAANGSVARFSGGAFLSVPTLNSSFSGASVFVVTKPTGLNPSARILDFGVGATANDNIALQISSAGSLAQYVTYNGSAASVASSSSALSAGLYHLIEAKQDASSNGTLILNGVPGSTNLLNTPAALARTTCYLGQSSGGTNPFSGDVAEVLVYYQWPFNCALTDTQRASVRAMLMQKYQALSQVPAAPIISVPSSTLLQPTQVAISSEANATVHFTLDGSTPDTTSPVSSNELISINYSLTLKAVAVKNGVLSSVSSSSYVLDPAQFAAPSPADLTPPTINMELPAPSL